MQRVVNRQALLDMMNRTDDSNSNSSSTPIDDARAELAAHIDAQRYKTLALELRQRPRVVERRYYEVWCHERALLPAVYVFDLMQDVASTLQDVIERAAHTAPADVVALLDALVRGELPSRKLVLSHVPFTDCAFFEGAEPTPPVSANGTGVQQMSRGATRYQRERFFVHSTRRLWLASTPAERRAVREARAYTTYTRLHASTQRADCLVLRGDTPLVAV